MPLQTSRLLLFFLLFLPIYSCNYVTNTHLLARGKVPEDFYLKPMDFEVRKGLIVVKATINGLDEDLEFIFDTGAFSNKISREVADKLGVKPVSSITVGDSQGNSREAPMALLDKVKLGELTFENVATGILDYPDNSIVECIAKDGIIGANLIRQCHWKIDFANRKLWMTDDFSRFSGELSGIQPIPFTHNRFSGKPRVTMKMDSFTLSNVLIDLGSNGGLDISRTIIDRWPEYFADKKVVTIVDNLSSGIWGKGLDTVLTFNASTVKMGSTPLTNVPVDMQKSGNPKIGLEVLRNYTMYLNYEKDEIYLVPSADREEKQWASFGFYPEDMEGSYFVVSKILTPSPASNAGLLLKDKIQWINGQPPGYYFETYCEYVYWVSDFLEQNDTLHLHMQDGRKLEVVKEDLLAK